MLKDVFCYWSYTLWRPHDNIPCPSLQYSIWEWSQNSSDRRNASFLGDFLHDMFNSIGIARQKKQAQNSGHLVFLIQCFCLEPRIQSSLLFSTWSRMLFSRQQKSDTCSQLFSYPARDKGTIWISRYWYVPRKLYANKCKLWNYLS